MDDLSDREREVLCAAAEGLTTRAIADRLYVSDKTVKNHLNHAYKKLGACNRASAVRRGIECGVIPLEGEPAVIVRHPAVVRSLTNLGDAIDRLRDFVDDE